MNINDQLNPGPDLYLKVRAGFVSQGTTLAGWCRTRSVSPTNARSALIGAWNGPAGKKLRHEMLIAAGIVHPSQLIATA